MPFPNIKLSAYSDLAISLDIAPTFSASNVTAYLAVQLNGSSWFVAATALPVPTDTDTGTYSTYNTVFNPAAANWRNLTITASGALIGSPAASSLTGVMTGEGQPCRHCVVRNVCYGVEPAFLAAFGTSSLRTVHELPEEVRTPLDEILEQRAAPPFYRVAFARVAERDMPLAAWAELLRFKQRCEMEVGDLCVERVAGN